MSSSSPPKPKPGSLRDRIAAFEQKPASSSAPPPPAPRPKPGNLSQWKPRSSSPPDTHQPVNDRNDTSMSANDAKESITKGGSLKERMAALQGLGAFGGGSAAAPPPKPAEKPKWKPPPQVAIAPPLTGDDDEGDNAEADNQSPISQLKAPSDDILVAISKHPQPDPAEERHSEIEAEAPAAGEEILDPDEEERQRRAAIAARMARLGGTRVGMGPPIFGRKPEIKPKPAALASEVTKEENVPVAEPAPRSEDDVEHAQAETEVAENVPLPTSPPTNETSTETLSPQPLVTPSEYFPQESAASISPNVPPRAMPVPQGPRRAAPPRKKSSQKQTPPAETEAIAPSLEKGTTIHDDSDALSESQSALVPVPGDVEPEVRAADPDVDVHPSELADKNLESTEQSFGVAVPPVLSPEAGSVPAPPGSASSPLDPQPDWLDNSDVDPSPTQSTGGIAESSSPTVSRITQEETEVEEVAVPHTDDEAVDAAEEEDEDDTGRGQRTAKMGGFDSLGEHSTRSLGEVPYIDGGVIPVESHSAAPAESSESIPYSVFQQGGGAAAVNEEDDGNDESDPRTQAPLQHALDLRELEGGSDYDDAYTRVPHEVEVGTFTHAAEIGQHSPVIEGERVVAASSPPSTVHGQHATDDFGATQAHDESASLAPALSADDISDDEMAPPRVTRPLPAAPEPSAPVSDDLVTALARAPPPPPSVPRRTSLPPPVRVIPVPSTDSPPRIQGSSPQRVPISKRTSLLPPTREIPTSAPDTVDLASSRLQPSTRRTSLPPPTRSVPPPSVSREGSLVPPPPLPPSLNYSEQDFREPGQTIEVPRIQDELIAPPPRAPTPTRKPSIAPPAPDGRRIVESRRRSTDSRLSHEERLGPGQYATLTAPVVPGPISTPSKKRVPSSLPLEQEILDDDIGDPIDPRFHAPKSPIISAIPRSPSPASGMDPVSSVRPATPPATPPAHSSANESGRDSLQRRRTIAERMAQLGGIKFGVPPPVNRVQPSAPIQRADDSGTEENTAGSGQPAPEEEEDEEDEQARRQRIAAKIAGMGGMRFGMLPIQPGIISVTPPPPPPVPVRHEEEATPRQPPRDIAPPRQPVAYYHEYEQEYEQPSSSDDGVQVEAEESELEEVRHEDLEDEYDEGFEEGMLRTPSPPPPPPPRSTRPPVPSTRPAVPLSLLPGRSTSFSTITPAARPPVRGSVSDFVMVEPEEDPLPSPVRYSHAPMPQWSTPLPQESSDLAGSGQWELPSIPSGTLDIGNSVIAGDLSGSMWSEDSTAYPPAAQPLVSQSPPPTSAPQQPVGPPRAPAAVVPGQVTADELRALWFRVGAQVGEAASRLLLRSKRTLVGNGSYEGFIAEALSQVPNASPPRGPGEYGILIYAQTAAQVHTRLTDILPGDIVVLDGVKLKGYKGLHTYSISAGEGAPCMGIVSEFDVKKVKLKVLQANQRVGQATVESVSYRLDDLKSGTIKVYRVQEA